MKQFLRQNFINLILGFVIIYLGYQKFVVNRPQTQIDFTELELIKKDGEPVSMNSFEGQPLFLSFYSSWCGPCMLEMPSIQKLYQEMKQEKMNFVLVNTTSFQDMNQVEEKFGVQVPQYLLRNSGTISVKTIPLTYIFDKHGHVVQVVNRPKNWNSNSVKKKLKKLISE